MILLIFYIIVFILSVYCIFNIKYLKRRKLFLFIAFFSWLFVIINIYFIIVNSGEAIQNLRLEEKKFFYRISGLIEYEIFWIFIYNWIEILLVPIIISVILTYLVFYSVTQNKIK